MGDGLLAIGEETKRQPCGLPFLLSTLDALRLLNS